jgi:hypothetical protein
MLANLENRTGELSRDHVSSESTAVGLAAPVWGSGARYRIGGPGVATTTSEATGTELARMLQVVPRSPHWEQVRAVVRGRDVGAGSGCDRRSSH